MDNLGAIGLNCGWHWWSPPGSYFKVVISAGYKQTTLPWLVIYLGVALKELFIHMLRPLPGY